MNSLQEIMKELALKGSEQTRKTFANHGAPLDKMYGVKVGDLKVIVKRVKKDYELSKALFDTGNSDAQYLAGLIGDEKKMTKSDLNKWAKNSTWSMISEYAVPFVAAESPHGWTLALEWIQSKHENIVSCGWATLSGVVSYQKDEDLDFKTLLSLLKKVEKEIHNAPNRVKYTMNNFVIALGSYVIDLYPKALETSKKIGLVTVDMGKTSCKVPLATDYIQKVAGMNKIGNKKKTVRC